MSKVYERTGQLQWGTRSNNELPGGYRETRIRNDDFPTVAVMLDFLSRVQYSTKRVAANS